MADQDRDGGNAGSGDREATAASAAARQGDHRDDAPGEGDGLGGVDAGSPGGMGGVRVKGGTGADRPPGGVSPVQAEEPGEG